MAGTLDNSKIIQVYLTDANGNPGSIPAPVGGALETTQAAGNVSLASLDTKMTANNTKLDTLITALTAANASLDDIEAAAENTAPTAVVNEGTSWLYIAASATDTAAGNANDLLDSILVIPATKSPGAVSIEDGAGTNYTLFAGGADSLTTLIPFPIDLRNIPAGTAWEITTGTNIAVIVFYRPRT